MDSGLFRRPKIVLNRETLGNVPFYFTAIVCPVLTVSVCMCVSSDGEGGWYNAQDLSRLKNPEKGAPNKSLATGTGTSKITFEAVRGGPSQGLRLGLEGIRFVPSRCVSVCM